MLVQYILCQATSIKATLSTLQIVGACVYVLYSGKVWQIVCDSPNQISTYNNDLLADLLICQTFFHQMLETSQFAKLSLCQTFPLYSM